MANVGGPYTGNEGSPIAMSAAASSDPEGGALTYSWDFGDGTTATGATVAKTYANSRTYTVTLAVTDGAGASSTASSTVAVADVPPTATFVAPTGIRVGATFTLSLTNAFDVSPKDHASGYAYGFDCGQGWFGAWTASSSVSCPAVWWAGTRTVRARVRDRWDYAHREYRKTISVIW
ncbi:MAG: PKD domain-containing protein [Gemmatimonadota bacterium]|nr:PKD domain-containing protein [Gemmatimonadota bacterium]